jgi:hypothetical protein
MLFSSLRTWVIALRCHAFKQHIPPFQPMLASSLIGHGKIGSFVIGATRCVQPRGLISTFENSIKIHFPKNIIKYFLAKK